MQQHTVKGLFGLVSITQPKTSLQPCNFQSHETLCATGPWVLHHDLRARQTKRFIPVHDSVVTCLISNGFFGEGERFFSACFSGNCALWDKNFEKLGEINLGASIINAAFSPDGRYIAVCRRWGALIVLRINDSKDQDLLSVVGQVDPLSHFIHHDGTRGACDALNVVSEHSYGVHENLICDWLSEDTLVISQRVEIPSMEGHNISTVSKRKLYEFKMMIVRLVDVLGKKVAGFENPQYTLGFPTSSDSLVMMAASHKTNLVAVSLNGGRVQIFDDHLRLKYSIKNRSNVSVRCLSWDRQGQRLLFPDGSEHLVVYDFSQQVNSSSDELVVLSPTHKFVKPANNCGSGEIKSCSWSACETRVWGYNEGGIWSLPVSPKAQIQKLCFGSKDIVATADSSESGDENMLHQHHAITTCGIDWSPDGRHVAVGDFSGNVFVWNVEGHLCTHAHNAPVLAGKQGNSIRSLHWKDSRSLFVGDMAGNVSVCKNIDLDTKQACERTCNLTKLFTMRDSVTSIRFYGDVLCACDATGAFWLYDYSMGKLATKFQAHDVEIWSCHFSPCGNYLATASEDRTTSIWRINSNRFKESKTVSEPFSVQHVTTIRAHSMAVTCVDWQETEMGTILATCSDDKRVFVYQTSSENGELLVKDFYTFYAEELNRFYVTYLAVESCGSRVSAVTEDGFLFVYDLKHKKTLFSKKIHSGSIEGLRWHPNNKLIATCGSDCLVIISDPSTLL